MSLSLTATHELIELEARHFESRYYCVDVVDFAQKGFDVIQDAHRGQVQASFSTDGPDQFRMSFAPKQVDAAARVLVQVATFIAQLEGVAFWGGGR